MSKRKKSFQTLPFFWRSLFNRHNDGTKPSGRLLSFRLFETEPNNNSASLVKSRKLIVPLVDPIWFALKPVSCFQNEANRGREGTEEKNEQNALYFSHFFQPTAPNLVAL